MTNKNNLRPIRCSTCGRFLGKANLIEGEVYLLCKNCKNWTVIMEGETERNITGKEIYEKLSRA